MSILNSVPLWLFICSLLKYIISEKLRIVYVTNRSSVCGNDRIMAIVHLAQLQAYVLL